MPKDKAVKMIKKYGTNDPFKIAVEKGITLLYEPLGKTLGYYNCYKRIQFIHINNSLNERMQKFVCAHELGHALLHRDSNTSFLKANTFYSIDRIEVEANTFAVELLLTDETIYKYKDSNLSINEVASIYGVPEEVAHLKNLHGLTDRVYF